MKLRIIGQRNVLGFGIHYSNFCDSLRRIYYIQHCIEEVDIGDQAALMNAASRSADDDINICFVPFETNELFRGFNVHWAIFESTRVPQNMLKLLSANCDLVWVPSHWGKETLVKNGLSASRIDVVPEGVNPNDYHPYLRGSMKRDSAFRFLTIGKFEQRKSYVELLEAFREVFGGQPDVRLVIKGDFFLKEDSKKKELTALVDALGLKNVDLYWGNWNQELMVALYNYCHVFLFPTKAEGWGLPLIEAAASGLPLITTYHSGHTEFLEAIAASCIFVDFTLKPIDDPDYKQFNPAADGEYGEWAVPDLSSLTQALVTAKNSYSELEKKALESSRQIRTRFSWDNSVAAALNSLFSRDLIRTAYNISSHQLPGGS